MPDLQVGKAVAEARPLWRVHRLLQLSGVPLYSPAWDERRRGRGSRRSFAGGDGAWGRSRERAAGHAPLRPLRPLPATWPGSRKRRREAQAREHPEGMGGRGHRPRVGAEAAFAAARGGHPSGDRKTHRGRHRPLWSVRGERREVRQSRQRRRGLYRRAEPGDFVAGGEEARARPHCGRAVEGARRAPQPSVGRSRCDPDATARMSITPRPTPRSRER